MEKWARFWGDSKRLVKPMGLAKSFGREVHIVLEADQIPIFQKVVKSHYRAYGRDLPWRNTEDPYKILVSEVMLQQTQVSRVIAKYESFLCAFPDIYSLAQAPLREVLNVWQGLGYNRRAVALQQAAQKVVKHFDQRIPSNVDSLVSLPGIGKATACAICTFAFNQPTLFIETNIRTAFIHYFFNCLTKVQTSVLSNWVNVVFSGRSLRARRSALLAGRRRTRPRTRARAGSHSCDRRRMSSHGSTPRIDDQRGVL
ncbi:MAG: hypothetical protein R6T98_03835, partial [Desulfatiglandales bacterium]